MLSSTTPFRMIQAGAAACVAMSPASAEVYQWRTATDGNVNTLSNWGINDDPNGPVPTVAPGLGDTLAISAEGFTQSAYTVGFIEPDTEFERRPFVGDYSALYVGRPFTVPERDTVRLVNDIDGTTLNFNNVEFGGDDAVVQFQGSPFVGFVVNTLNTDLAYDVKLNGAELNLEWNTGTLGFKSNPSEGVAADLQVNGALLRVSGMQDVRLNPVSPAGQNATGFHTVTVNAIGAFDILSAGLDIDAAPMNQTYTPLRLDGGFVGARRLDLGTGRTGIVDEVPGQVRVELAGGAGLYLSRLAIGDGGLSIGRELGTAILPAQADAVLEADAVSFVTVDGLLDVAQSGEIKLDRGDHRADNTQVRGRFRVVNQGVFTTDRFEMLGQSRVQVANAALDVAGALVIGPSSDLEVWGTIGAGGGVVIQGGHNHRFVNDSTVDADVTLGVTPGFSPGGFSIFNGADVTINGDLTFDLELDPFAPLPTPRRAGKITLALNADLRVTGDVTGWITVDGSSASSTFLEGKLAPGNDAVAWSTATFAGDLILSDTSEVEIETRLGLPGEYRRDAVDVDGTLVLNGTLTLATGPFDPLPAPDQPLTLIEAGSIAGTFETIAITGNSPVNPGQTLAVRYTDTQVLAQTALFGDANFNGQIEQGDLNAVLNNWGRDDGVSWVTGDLSQDGVVNQADLNAVLNHWGDTLNAPNFEGFAVPEPAAGLGLALLGGLAGRRRRRG